MDRLTWRRLPASALSHDTDLKSEWDRLNGQGLNSPFLCADAIVAALAEFGSGEERLLVASRLDRVVAILAVVPDGALRWRTFQPSQIPLGAWVADSGADLRVLVRSAMRGSLSMCLVLSVTQIDPLHVPRTSEEPNLRFGDYIETAWVELEGSFDDYWAARGKNLRQNMRKQRNKLASDGVPTAMRVLTAAEEMASVIARYGELESAGWKADQGTAIHPQNAQGRFYTRLFEDAARRGEALVFEYLIGGRTAAINLGLLRNGILVVLKTTYDETLPKSLSPAFLLREEELRHHFAGNDVRRIEYYGKLMDWHTKLTDKRRVLYHLTAYRWPFLKELASRRGLNRQQDKPAPALAAAHDPADT